MKLTVNLRQLHPPFNFQSFWLNMLQSNPGCVCVCLSVCLCVCLSVCLSVSSLQPKRMNRFWWNFTQMILSIFASVIFRGFWNFEFDDVIAAILHLRVAALSRSQFWSDFLQILRQEAHNSCIVWYWKSARSVNNFRSKKRTAFESHRCFGFRARLRGPGFESRQGQIFFFVIMNVFSYALRVTMFIWELKRYFQGNNQLSLNINRRFKNLVQELHWAGLINKCIRYIIYESWSPDQPGHVV